MLNNFFVYDNISVPIENGVYAPFIVGLSCLVVCLGFFIALMLAESLRKITETRTRRLIHIAGASALAIGIWSMHFLGMLSYTTDMAVTIDASETIVCLLIVFAVAYQIFHIARAPQLSAPKLCGNALLLGIALSGMHFIGMAAMHMDASIHYRPILFFLAIFIAILASGVALRIIHQTANDKRKYRYIQHAMTACLLGAVVSGMHFVGMAAAVYVPFAQCRRDPSQSFDTQELSVIILTGIVYAITFAFALVVRDVSVSSSKQPPFPIKLLTLSLILTLFAITWASSNSFYIDHKMATDIRRDLEINQLGNQISYADTITTRALRAFVLTGDPKWDATYQDNIKESNKAIGTLENITVDQNKQDGSIEHTIYSLARQIDKSTDFFLEASENKAIELAHAGDLAGARALLDGPEYTSRKQDYSDDVHELDSKTNQVLVQTLMSLARRVSVTLYLGVVVVMILPIVWFFAFRSIRQWRHELEKTRKMLVSNEKQLQLFIGEIEMSQTEAIKARQAAEQANATKSDFLANISHELRTPLNGILGMLRFLKEAQLGAEENGLVEGAFRSSTNLLEIVNDILDLSKIEAHGMMLEAIGMDLDYAIDSIVSIMKPIAKEKRTPLLYHKNDHNFPYVLGDPTRFTRILTNLIGNGIKYTDKGHVEIRVWSKEKDATHIEFHCEITDTGIGIPEDKLEDIFKKFVQADVSTTRKYGGTGLGLAITKQLVELMGGTIGVRSISAVGSTFWFMIPFETTDKISEEKYTSRKNRPMGTLAPDQARILVAEDHPINQLLIAKLLKHYGLSHFEIVENGADVLRRYREETWDVLLMDCHMPEMNGYDATKAIRDLEKDTGRHIPIVAMTAGAMIGDKEKCLRYGMDEYVSKPINFDELKEIMGQWICFTTTDHTPPTIAAPAEDAAVDLTILRTFTDGDADLEKELIGAFIKQSDINVNTLTASCTNDNAQNWSEAAHMLRGGSSSVGANHLAQLCREAQHFVGTAQDRAALLEKITVQYARAKQHLKEMGLLD